MRTVIALALTTLVACGGTGPGSPTTTSTVATTSETVVATTAAPLPLEIQDCSSPPVTFSALCEVYALLTAWHVDRPLSPEDLADVATRALLNTTVEATEEQPRTVFCAIPDTAFTAFCAGLREMVETESIAVGPVVDQAVVAMVTQALGPFTYYLPPDQVGSFRVNGVVGGVGVLLDARDVVGSKCAVIGGACQLEIVFVVEGNPGEAAGLMAGDLIVEVDGETIDGLGFGEVAGLIAGDETGQVQLSVERDGELLVFDLERAELTVPTVDVEIPEPGVGYIRIPDFESDIPDLVRQGLTALAEYGPSTLVVDLRDNPGGLVASAVDVADEFIDDDLIFESFGPDEHLEYRATAGGLATTPRLIVLVNKGSASAAEVLASALRDQRSALLVGTTTFGKDAVQIPFTLRNGGELYVAVARWASPDGDTVGEGGLTPDREVDLAAGMTIEQVVGAAIDAAS